MYSCSEKKAAGHFTTVHSTADQNYHEAQSQSYIVKNDEVLCGREQLFQDRDHSLNGPTLNW